MAWVDIQQNQDLWLDLRMGKVTGSAVGKIMANFGKAFGQPAKDLAVNIAIEQLTGVRDSHNYTNAHMERGHAEEPIARMLYEDRYFVDVTNGGFYDNGATGCSPDGLVNDDGVIEIKSVIPSVQYATIKKGTYDSKYKWQLAFNLKESGRDWIDYVSFCSSFPEGKRLHVFRITKNDFAEQFGMIDSRLAEFSKVIDEVKLTIRGQ